MRRTLAPKLHLALLATLALSLSAPDLLLAQAAPAAPNSGATDPTPICADRPTKSNGACTVDSGHFQYEIGLADLTMQRQSGVTTDTWLLFDPMLKYGIAPRLDLEANMAALQVVRTRAGDGRPVTLAGVGDLYLRAKWEFIDTHGDTVQAALLPYVKAPTARAGVGNGSVEGGLIVPASVKLSQLLTVAVGPEVDLLKNANDAGHHLATAQVLNLAVSLPRNVTVYGELWGAWNFDPTGTVRQVTGDLAVSYLATPRLQLDAGVNIGLNRATPGSEVYLGISQKF